MIYLNNFFRWLFRMPCAHRFNSDDVKNSNSNPKCVFCGYDYNIILHEQIHEND